MTTTAMETKKPTEVAKAQPTIKELLTGDEFKRQVALALPRHLKPDRFIRIALTALTRTPKLAQCTQASLFKCLLDLSALGLEPDGRRAHLIPFDNRKANVTECQLIVDYKGLSELVLRSGEVSTLHADIVCADDEFEYNMGEIRTHKIDFKKPRGAMYAAYAQAHMKDGTVSCQVLSKEEVDGIRKRSRAGDSGPWVTDYNEMAKKTAFRRLTKWLPLSPELREKIEVDDEIQAEVISVSRSPIAEPVALPAPAEEQPSGDKPDSLNMDQPPATDDQQPGAEQPVEKPGNTVTGIAENVSVKPTKKGTKRYSVLIGGEWYSTFDEKLGPVAEGLRGQNVKVEFVVDGDYRNLTSIQEA